MAKVDGVKFNTLIERAYTGDVAARLALLSACEIAVDHIMDHPILKKYGTVAARELTQLEDK